MKKILTFIFLSLMFTFTNIRSDGLSTITFEDSFLPSFNTFPGFIEMSADGTKIIYGDFDDGLYEWGLSTPFDLTTINTNFTTNFDYINNSSTLYGTFNNNGTRFYYLNQNDNLVYQYNFSTPYDLSTLTGTNVTNFNSGPFASTDRSIFLDVNNTLYRVNGNVLEKFGTINTVSDFNNTSISQTFTFSESTMDDVWISDDGTRLFTTSLNSKKFYEYSLSTAFDISTVTYVEEYFWGNDTSGNVWRIDIADDEANLFAVEATDTIFQYRLIQPEPPTYTIELSTNQDPYTPFIYSDDEETTLTNSIDKTILNDESWSVTFNNSTTTPYTFDYWYDLDNMEVFSTNRELNIVDPNRNYNLVATYTLNDSINLSFDSNHPSPPNFNLEVETLESNGTVGAIITQYPFSNYEHPEGLYYQINAPTDNIGVYEFDFWQNNEDNSVYSFNSLITSAGLESLDLTAIYSLPSEYQINLTLSTDIGFITFQLGQLAPVTGQTINVTLSENDAWTATAPAGNNDFIFNNWLDLSNGNIVSNNNVFSVESTIKNYVLEANYATLYDVNWNTDGGTSIPTQYIKVGDFVNQPDNPSKPDFAFGGWYEEGDANQTQVNFSYQVTNDITFVAIWLDTYTLTFDTNGGGRIDSITYIATETPDVVTPSRFGYEFQGWFTDDGTFQNAFDFTNPLTQDTTIHAKWAFGSDRDAQLSLTTFLDDNDLGDGFSQIVIMISIYIFVNIIIFIYQAPLIVTLILNFIVTSLFMILGWIAIWIVVVIFMALFGLLYFFSSGRGITE